MKTYNNIEIVTMIENEEFKDGDLVFIVPAPQCEEYAESVPYIWNEALGELVSDKNDLSFIIEKGSEYTINDIHPLLLPYVDKKYFDLLFVIDDKFNLDEVCNDEK